MAIRCPQCETNTAASEHDLNDRPMPASPVSPIPEAIPLPKTQPGKEPTTPGKVEPSPTGTNPAVQSTWIPPAAIPLPDKPTTTDPLEPSPTGANSAAQSTWIPPEAIPLPKASTTPDPVEPLRSDPPPQAGTEQGEAQVPPEDKELVPIKRTGFERSSN